MNQNLITMKKYKGLLAWAAACIWAVGGFGGTFVAAASGYYFISVCTAITAAGAFPFLASLFKKDVPSE